MYCRFAKVACFVVAVAVIGMACQAYAEICPFAPKDSSQFTYRYEMGILPSDINEDQDDNDLPDFSIQGGGTPCTLDGNGVMRLNATGGQWVDAGAATEVYTANFVPSAGYTVEFKAKVISQTEGYDAAMQFFIANTDRVGAQFFLTSSDVKWVVGGVRNTISTGSTTDDFHTYRIATEPVEGASKFWVWRDDVEIGSGLVPGYAGSFMGLYFGSGSGAINGVTDIDYVRLMPGGFSPVPEPSAIALLATGLFGLLAYAWRKRR